MITKKSQEEESYKVSGKEIKQKIEELIREGNARRIIIKNEKGVTVMEFPVTAGVIGVVIAPILAAVGALAAILTSATIIVEKKKRTSGSIWSDLPTKRVDE